tara:strand:- start:929 stop:1270 length:342 start_codon:yes stop_codon:yes gene_type:complete
MPRIKNLQIDSTITDDDKLLGTETSTGKTKNYKIGDIKNYIKKARLHTHHQNSAATTWTINHNLGMYPNVSLKFSSSDNVYNNVGAFAGVVYTNNNTITINLAAAESGYAYLN